jgi:NADH-quinone oxidoreductase subunit N
MGLAAGTEIGASSILVYLSIHMIMNTGIFAGIISMRRKKQTVENITDLAGLSKTHPVMAFSLLVLMFSMAGIPPLAGFFAKWFVFLAAVDSGLYFVALIGGLSSFIGVFCYLRIIKIMYFDELIEPLDASISNDLNVIMFASMVVMLLFFVVPEPLISAARIVVMGL